MIKEYCCNSDRIKHEILRVLFEHWKKTTLKSSDPNDLFLTSSKISTLTKLKCPHKEILDNMYQLSVAKYIKMDYIKNNQNWVSYRLDVLGEQAYIQNEFKQKSDITRTNTTNNFRNIVVPIIMVLGILLGYFTYK